MTDVTLVLEDIYFIHPSMDVSEFTTIEFFKYCPGLKRCKFPKKHIVSISHRYIENILITKTNIDTKICDIINYNDNYTITTQIYMILNLSAKVIERSIVSYLNKIIYGECAGHQTARM